MQYKKPPPGPLLVGGGGTITTLPDGRHKNRAQLPSSMRRGGREASGWWKERGSIMSNIFNRKSQKLKRQFLRNSPTTLNAFSGASSKENNYSDKNSGGNMALVLSLSISTATNANLQSSLTAQRIGRRRQKNMIDAREEYIERYGIHFCSTNSSRR